MGFVGLKSKVLAWPCCLLRFSGTSPLVPFPTMRGCLHFLLGTLIHRNTSPQGIHKRTAQAFGFLPEFYRNLRDRIFIIEGQASELQRWNILHSLVTKTRDLEERKNGILQCLYIWGRSQVVLKMSLTTANSPRLRNTQCKELLDNWLILDQATLPRYCYPLFAARKQSSFMQNKFGLCDVFM